MWTKGALELKQIGIQAHWNHFIHAFMHASIHASMHLIHIYMFWTLLVPTIMAGAMGLVKVCCSEYRSKLTACMD